MKSVTLQGQARQEASSPVNIVARKIGAPSTPHWLSEKKEISLRVEFNQTYGDLLLFSLLHNFLLRKNHWFAAGLSGLTVAALLAFNASAASIVQGAAIAYAVFWVGYLLLLILYFRTIGVEKLIGPKTIELQSEALFEETHFNQAYHYWPNIVKAVRRPGCIAVYISPSVAHVIPTRAFRNKHERGNFWLALQQYWKSGADQVRRPDLILEFALEPTAIPEGVTSGTMPKHLLGACALYIAARGAMAVLAPLYETGAARVTSPVLMLLFIMLVVLFMCRVSWTWRLISPVVFAEIVVNSIFFPSPGYFRGYLALSQLFTALAIAAACIMLWSVVWRRQTKSWFQGR